MLKSKGRNKMLAQIEKQLKLAKQAATTYYKTLTQAQNDKYMNMAEKNAARLQKELDKIYAMYAEVRAYEEKVCKKFDIETY